MDKQKCQRCNTEEYIPTHQYVKYDNVVNYFCGGCWGIFKKWLNSRALRAPKPNPGRLYSSGYVSGREESVELTAGTEPAKKIRLKLETALEFGRWFHRKEAKDISDKTE
ncbi:MAG: hypothetical protein AABW58_03575 [Nanoarchaeota archaeon]